MIIHTRLLSVVLPGVMILNALGVTSQEPSALPTRQEAQQAEPAGAPEARVILQEGTEVHLKLAQSLTSKTATIGEPVEFVLGEDLKIGDYVVARQGTRALGTVAEGKKSERQRREARQLSMRFDHMKVGNAIVTLRGEQANAGKRDAGKMVAFTILFGLSGLLMSSGKKFIVPEGTPVSAYVDQDIELPVLAPTQAPKENPIAPEPGKVDSGSSAP
jgi:hypothetical protein